MGQASEYPQAPAAELLGPRSYCDIESFTTGSDVRDHWWCTQIRWYRDERGHGVLGTTIKYAGPRDSALSRLGRRLIHAGEIDP